MTDVASRLTAALSDRYRLERKLGQGGMATVYLAQDLKHDRQVAIKVLRPELAAVIGAERFLSEIKTTANLQHPHILPLFDSGAADSFLFYVMPFIDGESLRERLTREQQLPIADAVRIASEIASALDYAHRRNIIHRDIKPENILLHDGRALVADFGIALAASKVGGSRMTETGMSLGTPTYMSPEQAMGQREITAKSDVYALGCVLYEMLVGEPPFTGPTAQAIVARVMTEAPRSLTLQRRTIPAHVDAAVAKALEKLPADRFQSAARFSDALGAASGDTTSGASVRAHAFDSRSARGRLARFSPWVVAAILLAALGVQQWRAAASRASRAPIHFAVELGLGTIPTRVPTVLLSNDGTRLVYSAWVGGQSALLQQKVGELTATPIAGSEGASRAFFSYDGRWVAFISKGKLKKLAIDGGTPVLLADSRWGGGSWGRDGTIVYTRSYSEGLWEIDSRGGSPRMLTEPDSASGELGHWWPQILPDGEHILFTAYRSNSSEATIEVFSKKTKKRTVLLRGGTFARYVPTGYLIYAKDETILAAPMDLERLTLTGGALPVLQDVAMSHGDGYAAYALADNGTFAYLPATSFNAEKDLVIVNRRGGERLALPAPNRYEDPRFSPDETRLSVSIRPLGAASDVWVFPIGSERGTRITDDPGQDWGAIWTPDGRELIYIAEHSVYGLYRRAADASQPARVVLSGGIDRLTGSITADGSLLAYVYSPTAGPELRTVALRGEPTERPYISNVLDASKPSISPDSRWMAYESVESGLVEVYVQSFPDPTLGRWKLSTNGGSEPVWTRGGREVVFRQRDTVMAVTVDPARNTIGTPTVLFGGPYVHHSEWGETRSYDVSRDGERFLMLRQPPERLRRRIVVTLNWPEELRLKVPR